MFIQKQPQKASGFAKKAAFLAFFSSAILFNTGCDTKKVSEERSTKNKLENVLKLDLASSAELSRIYAAVDKYNKKGYGMPIKQEEVERALGSKSISDLFKRDPKAFVDIVMLLNKSFFGVSIDSLNDRVDIEDSLYSNKITESIDYLSAIWANKQLNVLYNKDPQIFVRYAKATFPYAQAGFSYLRDEKLAELFVNDNENFLRLSAICHPNRITPDVYSIFKANPAKTIERLIELRDSVTNINLGPGFSYFSFNKILGRDHFSRSIADYKDFLAYLKGEIKMDSLFPSLVLAPGLYLPEKEWFNIYRKKYGLSDMREGRP